MLSGKASFEGGWFNSALLRKNLSRFWPLWGLYGLFWFFFLPAAIFLLINGEVDDCLDLMRMAPIASVFTGCIYGVLAAMALFSYLMNAPAANFTHALPIRREGLLLTNLVSGGAFIALPTGVVFLLSLLGELATGCLTGEVAGRTLLWLALNFCVTFFFFSLAAFCAMFTGHILALPVFYGILNFLVVAICFLLDMVCDVLLVGFNGYGLSNSNLAWWCTPVYRLFGWLDNYPEPKVTPVFFYTIPLSLLFLAVVLLVYRKRQLELAGNLVTVGWARHLFQHGLGICVGLSLGTLFYTLFCEGSSTWWYIVCVVPWALVGAFAARMLLKKTLRVFREWRSPVALALCLVLLLGAIRLDLLGFQRRVPSLESCSWVELYGVSSYPEDSASYLQLNLAVDQDERLSQEVIDLHHDLLSDFSRLLDQRNRWAENWEGNYQVAGTAGIRLNYRLKNGSSLGRTYSVPFTQEEIETPGTFAYRLNRLVNDPEMVKRSYLSPNGQPLPRTAKPIDGYLYNYRRDYWEDRENDLTDLQLEELWAAFMEDLNAGRVRRYLLDNRERQENCYVDNDISFEVAMTYDSNPRNPASVTYSSPDSDVFHVEVTPQKSMTSLLSAIHRLGLDQLLEEQRP